MGSGVVRQILVGAISALLGTLAAQYLINNVRSVRRAVGAI